MLWFPFPKTVFENFKKLTNTFNPISHYYVSLASFPFLSIPFLSRSFLSFPVLSSFLCFSFPAFLSSIFSLSLFFCIVMVRLAVTRGRYGPEPVIKPKLRVFLQHTSGNLNSVRNEPMNRTG